MPDAAPTAPPVLPAFYEFGLDVLRALSASPDGMRRGDIYSAVAAARQLAPEAMALTLQSGGNVFQGRVGWVLSYLKDCGWLANPRRSWWHITPSGAARLARGTPITVQEMKRTQAERHAPGVDAVPDVPVAGPEDVPLDTPEERIESARQELAAEVGRILLQRLAEASPRFFEGAVLRLLAAMGYAGKLGAAVHAGKTGDGGIDGILYLDRLHLERVYVQAKRWKGSVGSSVVRDFAGAMDAESATKGVILTVGTFTAEARAYVERSPKAIRLIDGAELVELMTEFGVGVSRERVVVLPRVDEDFFEDA